MIPTPGKKSTSGSIELNSNPEILTKIRPGHIAEEEVVVDGDNDSFASADDIGVLNVAFDDAIDNLTRSKTSFVLNLCAMFLFCSIANDNFSNRPISRFIAQVHFLN